MAKLFISYTSEHKEYAQQLENELDKYGHTTWWFDKHSAAGSSWQEEIIKSISEVDVIVPLLTTRALSSAWINHEIGAAVAYAQERGKPLIIPVVLGNVEIPINLQRYHCIYDLELDVQQTALHIVDGINAFWGRQKARKDEQKEKKEQVEKSAADFVSNALVDLRKRESTYRSLAYFWYGLSYLTLVGAAGWGLWRATTVDYSAATIYSLLQIGIAGILVLALLIALAKYSFTLGKSFMVESLRNADRCHAISFGEFYLKAFGEKSSSEQIMEAFKDWNIDKGSFFFNQNSSDFDPQLIQLIAELARAFASNKKK